MLLLVHNMISITVIKVIVVTMIVGVLERVGCGSYGTVRECRSSGWPVGFGFGAPLGICIPRDEALDASLQDPITESMGSMWGPLFWGYTTYTLHFGILGHHFGHFGGPGKIKTMAPAANNHETRLKLKDHMNPQNWGHIPYTIGIPIAYLDQPL